MVVTSFWDVTTISQQKAENRLNFTFAVPPFDNIAFVSEKFEVACEIKQSSNFSIPYTQVQVEFSLPVEFEIDDLVVALQFDGPLSFNKQLQIAAKNQLCRAVSRASQKFKQSRYSRERIWLQ